MSSRRFAVLGIAANVLFWTSLLVFAALRPEYSHFTKAVSELGAWGAPNMWAWNALGFVVPGVLLALFGWALARHVSPSGWMAASLLALAGICVALAGLFPADMSNFQSVTTIGHLIGSNGSALCWGAALVVLAFATRKTWPALAIVSALALVLMIASFSLYGTSLFTRAIVQRITFGVFFGWYLVTAVLLMTRRTTSGPPTRANQAG